MKFGLYLIRIKTNIVNVNLKYYLFFTGVIINYHYFYFENMMVKMKFKWKKSAHVTHILKPYANNNNSQSLR